MAGPINQEFHRPALPFMLSLMAKAGLISSSARSAVMTIPPPVQPTKHGNAIRDTILRIRLIWRLMRDKRVLWWLKLLPAAALAYIVLPIDLLFDFTPIFGYADDLGIFLGSVWLFVELCPKDVVAEHWNYLNSVEGHATRVDVKPKELTSVNQGEKKP
jgi:uncharacterized membrane protein YkvA (DUF1232 family)